MIVTHYLKSYKNSKDLRPVYCDTTQLNSTDLLRADWLYAATGSIALSIAGDS